MAVITTIVGAAVAANLTLIVFDIAYERSVREGVIAKNAGEAVARPSTG